MLRILSRQGPQRLGKSADGNQGQLDDESPILDLARTVDDDDDSRFVLYSDVEEDVRDFALHVRRSPSESELKDERPGRRKKRQSRRSPAAAVKKEERDASVPKGSKPISRVDKVQLDTATPVRTVQMKQTFLDSEDTPDLDGIIREFANRRDSPRRMKRRGLPRKKRTGVREEDGSNSSYQSGFSSSESSNSSRGRVTSLLFSDTDQLYMEKGEPSLYRDLDDDDEPDCHYDSLYARYGNSRDQTSRRNQTKGEGFISTGLIPPRPLDTDGMSSAGESDACSRRSFSSFVSYTRSIASASIRKLWHRKKKTSEHATQDITERTAESGSSFQAEDANIAVCSSTRSEKHAASSFVSPVLFSSSQSLNPAASNRSRATVTSSPLATGSMPVEVRGFDCDTGGFVDNCNLAKSSVLDPTPTSLKPTVLLTQRFIAVSLHDLDKSSDSSSQGSVPRVSYVIDPMDMQKFLKSEDTSRSKARQRDADDEVSSLSSNSTLTLSPKSVIEGYCSRTKKTESAVSIRAKSLMSSRINNLRYEGLNDAAEQVGQQASAKLRQKKSTSALRFPAPHSPKRTYVYPSTLQVTSTQRSMSVLLIEPVLKVFEIVSVGVNSETTARDVIQCACVAAADHVLSEQTYVSICGATHVISNLNDPVAKLLPANTVRGVSDKRSSKEENMRREMERTLLVAVPENSNPSECIKIRHMLWKNPKLQVWWTAIQKGRTPRSSTSARSSSSRDSLSK